MSLKAQTLVDVSTAFLLLGSSTYQKLPFISIGLHTTEMLKITLEKIGSRIFNNLILCAKFPLEVTSLVIIGCFERIRSGKTNFEDWYEYFGRI